MAFYITAGDTFDGSQRLDMDNTNVKIEAIWQASSPRVTAHAADTSGVAGGELLDSLHIAPPLRPVQGMVDCLADCLDRRFDMPDGDKTVLHHCSSKD